MLRPNSCGINRVDLERAVGELPPGYRLIFILHDIEGYHRAPLINSQRAANRQRQLLAPKKGVAVIATWVFHVRVQFSPEDGMNPDEIIGALKHWPEGPDGVAYLVVAGHNQDREAIRHDDPNALRKLSAMLAGGWKPIGFIGLSSKEEETQVRIAPIADYDKDAKALCMAFLSTLVGDVIREGGGVPMEN